MKVMAALLLAAGCTSRPEQQPFGYQATAGWYSGTTPNVVSLSIDGQVYASGQTYSIDATFPTYEDALASFVPRNVVITTTTETLTFQLDIGACEMVPYPFTTPITKETDQFFTVPSQQQPPAPSVQFFSECGSCTSNERIVGYCARAL